MKSKHKQATRLEWQKDYGESITVKQTVNAHIESRTITIEREVLLDDRNDGYIGVVKATPADMFALFGRPVAGRYIVNVGGEKLTTAGVKHNAFTKTYKPDPISLQYEAVIKPLSPLHKAKWNEVVEWSVESQAGHATTYVQQRVSRKQIEREHRSARYNASMDRRRRVAKHRPRKKKK